MRIKKYIKNYRNNNFPETLFLVGVFILSIGLFIEPQSTWFLGIHFYKSDLQTITTIAKILGTVIISSSIILNLKKYTNKGGTQYVNNVKDTKIEKEDVEEKEPVIDIIKTETYLKKTGGFIVAVGCLTLVVNTGIYLYYFFNKETVLSSVFLLMFAVSIVFIILGKRIKNLNDINTKLYLNLVTILSLLFGVVVVYSGGRIGILFFFLIGYLVISLRKIHIAMKVKDFYSKLSIQKYKFNKNSWITFIVIFLGLLTFFIIKDIQSVNYYSNSKIDWEKEYGTNESDSLYDKYLKEKEASSGVYNELDKGNDSKNTVLTDISDWTTYNSEDNKFSILFPEIPNCPDWYNIPSESMSKSEDISNHILVDGLIKGKDCYIYVENNGNYSVDVYSFPETFVIKNAKDFLEKVLINKLFYKAKESTILYQKSGLYNGYPSIEIYIKDDPQGFNRREMYIIKNHKIYNIGIFYSSEYDNRQTWIDFINSFKILK